MHMDFIEKFLDGIDTMTIIEKLNEFKRLNIKNLSDNELADSLINALTFNLNSRYILRTTLICSPASVLGKC